MPPLLPDSLSGRAVLLLVAGLLLTHVASMTIHYADAGHALPLFGGARAVERIAGAAALADRLPRGGAGWTVVAPDLVVGNGDLLADGVGADWRARIAAAALGDRLPGTTLLVRVADSGTAGLPWSGEASAALAVRMETPDGPLLLAAPLRGADPHLLDRLLWELAVMGLGIVVLSAWAAWWLTRPLTLFAAAAERIGKDIGSPSIDEAGPREIRRAASAFNHMQTRLRRFVEDRTEMLAAISHDLRTPITRLRIRAEFVEDAAERAQMLATLDEMEHMTDSALAFARDVTTQEKPQRVSIDALIESLCTDAADAGGDVRFEGGDGGTLTGRPIALKRGFGNLVANAVRYGGGAVVRTRRTPAYVVVEIDDDGPGIPESEFETVFTPFYRLDRARSSDRGGAGLGLAVARSVFRGHGGEVTLANRPAGGLRVTVSLPR